MTKRFVFSFKKIRIPLQELISNEGFISIDVSLAYQPLESF